MYTSLQQQQPQQRSPIQTTTARTRSRQKQHLKRCDAESIELASSLSSALTTPDHQLLGGILTALVLGP
jgi:predicted nucleic acid-binding protein